MQQNNKPPKYFSLDSEIRLPRVENAHSTLRCQWHSLQTENTSSVSIQSKQAVSSTIGLLRKSYALSVHRFPFSQMLVFFCPMHCIAALDRL